MPYAIWLDYWKEKNTEKNKNKIMAAGNSAFESQELIHFKMYYNRKQLF